MKNLITYLKTLWGAWGNLQSNDVICDRRLTVGSPSGLNAKWKQNPFMRFAAVFALVLVIGVGNVWGATVTYSNSDFSGGGTSGKNGEFTVTQHSPISVDAVGYKVSSHIRFYGGGEMTISGATITQVVFTCTSNAYATALAGFTFSSGSCTASSTTATWKGSTTSLTITSNAQTRYTQFVVTYTASCTKIGAPTVTATPGDGRIDLSWSNQTGASSYSVTKTPAGGTVGTPSKSGSTWSCAITGLTNGTTYTWSVEAVGSGDYCADNTPATGDATPNVLRTITYYDKDGQHTTSLADGTNIATALTALYGGDDPVSCDATNYEYFVGWKVGEISGTASSVTLLDDEVVNAFSPSNNYYAVWSDTDPSAGGWTKVTSISAGDVIVLVNETASKELTSVGLINTTSCGKVSDYTTTPAGTFPLTVETGYGGTGFSFKNSTNYLSWSSGNSLTTSATKNNASSWTVNTPSSGNFTFTNVGDNTRILQYNSGSPRFCCYTSSQQPFQIYKQSAGGAPEYITTCCTDPGLAYGTASVTKTFGNGTFKNTLTNSHSVSVTYESSNTDVATIASDGTVTIQGAGNATITARFAGNSTYCADEASYTLTVNKADISPTLTYTPNSVAVGEKTSAPTVGGNPGSGGVTYAITSATPSGCATINTSTGVVTGVAVGSVTVTATVAATTNYNGGTATATVTINAAANFTNNKTVFIQGESSSAWDESACVKAWFNASGDGGAAQTTYWLFDAAGGGDDGKKVFATVVPADGNLNKVQLQRFASNCSTWWNSNGDLNAADANGSNTFRSTGSGTSNVAWNASGIELWLYGSPDSWTSSLATFADQGGGVWVANYNNYTPTTTSDEFKINTSYNGWIGNTGSNNNATLDGMHVGSTYNITATLDVTTHALTMSKTFVKGTVHFDMQGHGSAISDLTNVPAGSKISAPSTPSATGYDFGGWYKEPACTNAWNFGSDVVSETMTLYAKWTKNNYTITSTLNHCSSSPAIPSSYEYTGSAASLSYTITPSDGYRLPTTITVTGTTHTWDSATGTLVLTGTITSNVTITITAVQTHTVTWLNNGSNYDDPVVYDHGATLAFPASDPSAPSSCSGKVFVGWTSDPEITSETSTEPTLITAGGAVNTDATYRAVFADVEESGTKWVLTSLNAVTAGTYAILNQDNQAFKGTITDGHGDCTSDAFSFTNGEATSAPTGMVEVTIEVQSSGFSMYNTGSSKYLYASKAGSGGLNQQTLKPTDYWYYDNTNWKYNHNYDDKYPVFRSYSSADKGLRIYGNNSGNGVIKLAKKTGGISYDNYITQCCSLKPVTGLAVSSSTANSVTLTWTAPSPTTGIDHLELRNASTDAKIGSDIAVGTTTTSVSGLTECNTYSYKIVSVGASCETSSDAIEAQPFSGAKTVTFNYNGGSGSPTSFTTSCAGNTVALPTPDTRTGYTFLGWWSAQFDGGKQGDAGDNYTVSGTTTLWAHWSETNYTVTMQQSPAAGATLTGGTTTAHYGGTINISTDVPSGYRFNGWTSSPSVTFANASATSTSFTMPASNVTVTANFVQVHTLTFITPSGGGSVVTPPATADHGGTVTLPNVTGIAAEYSCETFLGWTTTAPNAEGGTKWSSTPTIKAAGATSDVINSNTTFYAVYSRSGGGASGTVELTCTDVATWKSDVLGNVTNAYGTSTTRTATDGSLWTTTGQIADAGDINLKDGYYLKIPSLPGNISTITMVVSQQNALDACAEYPGSLTTKAFYFRATADGSNLFSSETTSSRSRTITITSGDYATGYICCTDGTGNIHSVTVNYGPAPVISHNVACPDCEISQFTLSYNANTTYFPGSTTTCTGVTDYIWAEHDDIYTICSTEPTLAGYKFTGWATNANGSGTVYEAGQEISCVPETPLTLYAQYERVYTITFNDMGSATNRTQGAEGAAVSVPSHTTPCVMAGATWEFAGWSKTGGSLSDAASATIDIAANATEYTPAAIDEGQTFYAVYKKTLSGGGAFSVGKSGVYKFYYHSGSGDYWAAGKQSTYGIYSTTTAGDAHSFRFTYYPTGTYAGKYTIQNDLGEYIGYSGSSTPLVYNASAADNHYYWTITASGGGFIVQNVQTTTRYLASNGGHFNGKTSSEVLSFVAADVVSYYTIMTCASSFSITFEDGAGTINWEVGHAEGTYQDVADGTVFTVFPTATMDGWTFIGWTAGQGYSDMSKYSEGRDATTGSGVIVPEDADIYSTGGNSYTIHSNITMYPVFTRFEDNEPIDLTNGGEYYMYYLAPGTNDGYGAEQRVYAAAYDGSKRYNSSALCSAATTFTFTKLGNGNWTIYDNTTNMYLYGIEEDNDLKQQASATGAEWTLTINGNQFDAYHVGTSYGQLIAYGSGTSATFMNYRRTNVTDNPALYHRVYLGSCTNRVFSSNPSTTPEIDLKGTVVITASQNGAVRNTNVLTVSGHNLTPNTGEITITSNNSDVYFSTSANSSFAMAAANQPKPSVTVTADASGIVTPTSIYVHYKPSSNADAWTDATITASYTGAEDAEVTAELRTVKENFVIAAKIANSWYALPANMAPEGVFEPVLIDVDESAKIAYGPATVGYKMWPVQTVNGGTDEYAANGDKVRFADNSNAGLWASNSDNNIRNWSAITAIGSTAETPASYEWIIDTEDRNAYTLKSMYSTNYLDLYRPTSGGHAGKLVWASNSTYETNEIHFFPLTERATINIIPREWKANGLVFSVPADNQITAASYKIGTGSETSTTYTRHSTGGYGLYEVALPDLTSQYGKLLTLKLTISGTPTYATATIPIIVNANASTKDSEPFATLDLDAKNYDVVVLSGKTLTTNASASEACKFQNLYLYPGATLVNTTNGNLSVSYLEMRGGIKGIDAKSSLEQDVPHLMLGKKMSSTAGANLDMYVNTAHSYALSVPFDVTLSNVNFANSLNTTTSAPINGTLDGQFMIMEYDGEQRASTGKGWKHITSTERTLHAGEGYVLQGKRPKGQPFAVIRFPFTGVNNWADNTNGEVAKSEIPIYAHNGGATTPDNDKGWNLIANPYMATISYNGQEEGYAADFTVGYLEKTDTDPWDGKYEWKSTTNAYVTIPNDSYTAFPQYRANSAQAVYEPFKNFFIQTNADGSVMFDKSLRAAMPSYMKANEVTTPIYADINIAHGNAQAEAGITIDPKATTGYKFGEDQNIFENRNDLNYLKMYTVVDGHYLVGNTITPAEAEQLIPLEFFAPDVDREYVFSLSSTTDEEKLEYVMLYDALGSATNLLQYPYSVVLTESGIIENRFSIGLKAKSNDQTPTDIRDVDDGIEQPLKFIWQDKMYILRGGVIYDATGKRIKTINK